MHIGINARTFLTDEPGGAVQTAIKIAKRLAERDDVEVTLYGSKNLKNAWPNNVSIRGFGYPNKINFFGVIWERSVLPALASRDDIDILLCPNGNAPMTPVNCPIITYIHDINAQKGMSSGVHQIYRRLLVPQGVKVSNKIITVSEFSKREIQKHLPVHSSDIHAIYNGVDDYYLNNKEGVEYELPEEYILYVGSMNPRKNISNLIKSFNIFKDKIDSNYKLVLIGPGNKYIFKKIDMVEDGSDIITPGFVSQPELKYIYKNASLFAYISKYEGFGLPPLEAMACGTPVVASESTSLPEVLNGAAAFVDPEEEVEIADKFLEVVSNKDVRNKLQRDGLQHVQSYTWESTIDKLLAIFEDVK
ncbi:glycosyltransferase family 4 protein [Haloarcula nitratireducens]|uniref:Glycosyltransferase family 4 protein n=1 Tax=Haloarcula nitratireducens TaxID=2487749 RepID=A0AAW4PEA3_9EURY|nr:glycosyltransferase family 1 protein [Halomicroarcula nitratireducens]MBX0296661.1 glycosyltransferase family 4 protein [Halomicroarcula nitratireducens]